MGPAGLTTQGTPGQGGQIPADSASVGPLGPMLLSSDEDDDEALSSGAEERADAYTDMSHEPDGIFTFRLASTAFIAQFIVNYCVCFVYIFHTIIWVIRNRWAISNIQMCNGEGLIK